MPGGQFRDEEPPFRRERPAARVLEGRDRVEEADRAVREVASERVGIEPLVVHLHRANLGAEAGEELQRPVVGRRLDEDAARPRLEELLGVEEEALERAGGEQHSAGIDPVPCREQLAQRP